MRSGRAAHGNAPHRTPRRIQCMQLTRSKDHFAPSVIITFDSSTTDPFHFRTSGHSHLILRAAIKGINAPVRDAQYRKFSDFDQIFSCLTRCRLAVLAGVQYLVSFRFLSPGDRQHWHAQSTVMAYGFAVSGDAGCRMIEYVDDALTLNGSLVRFQNLMERQSARQPKTRWTGSPVQN